MDYEVKVIPEQKLGVINCKTPIEDLGIFLSMLMILMNLISDILYKVLDKRVDFS